MQKEVVKRKFKNIKSLHPRKVDGMTNKKNNKPVIGITIGDINGVGPEIIMKALNDNRIINFCTPVIYGSSKTLSFYRKLFKMEDFNYNQARREDSFHTKKINVVNCWEEAVEINVGKEVKQAGDYALKSIEQASEDLKLGRLDAVVTAPINKKLIQSEDFSFPGHTEYFTEKFEAKDSLMLLVDGDLKIGTVTGHIPLKDVPVALTKEKIESKLKILFKTLKKDFDIQKPKVAVLGLNPHAGEDGLLGKEEVDIIAPVVEDFKNKGQLIFGPYPSDGFFGSGQYKKYDAVLAMYHDQGLIPFKTMAFDEGVNYTAGLSAVRTSPDHGTAYSIAGKNTANEKSLLSAVFLAIDIVKNRTEQLVTND